MFFYPILKKMFPRTIYILLTLFFLLFSNKGKAQSVEYYETAYDKITYILNNEDLIDFKDYVFLVENAYFDNKLDKVLFDDLIWMYANICRGIIQSGNIIYPEKDKEKASTQCATFLFMTDSIDTMTEYGLLKHSPFEYNFDDFTGQKEWSNMFVSTLMETKKGNCHSLPILYKLIMNELGEEAHLALSPNHMYIKVNNKRVGWYNIELTNGDFPTDAWIMASSYIHLDAITNGIYMKALTDKESIALCLVDMAQGYERKFGIGDGEFIIKCCDTALEHFPMYINAMLLKAETLTALYKKNNDSSLFAQMTELYTKIHELGYRKMPEDMYQNWLNSMGTMTTNHRMKSLIYNTDEIQ